MTGRKEGVYSLRRAQSAHRDASTNPYSPSDSNPSGGRGRSPRGGLHFGRASRHRLVAAPIEHGGRRPAALRQGDSAIAVDFARALRGLPSYKARDGLRCLRQFRDGSNRGGLGREIMRRAVADLNPAADLSRSASCRFFAHSFCNARAQKCLESCPTVETVKETQKKLGASRGDNQVVTGLANCERAVCRVAGLGGLPSRISRSIGPQRRRWTTSFSTSPAGSARAISPGTRASRT
jgi:hypothetical protein